MGARQGALPPVSSLGGSGGAGELTVRAAAGVSGAVWEQVQLPGGSLGQRQPSGMQQALPLPAALTKCQAPAAADVSVAKPPATPGSVLAVSDRPVGPWDVWAA